jgi:hypothetical protein
MSRHDSRPANCDQEEAISVRVWLLIFARATLSFCTGLTTAVLAFCVLGDLAATLRLFPYSCGSIRNMLWVLVVAIILILILNRVPKIALKRGRVFSLSIIVTSLLAMLFFYGPRLVLLTAAISLSLTAIGTIVMFLTRTLAKAWALLKNRLPTFI